MVGVHEVEIVALAQGNQPPAMVVVLRHLSARLLVPVPHVVGGRHRAPVVHRLLHPHAVAIVHHRRRHRLVLRHGHQPVRNVVGQAEGVRATGPGDDAAGHVSIRIVAVARLCGLVVILQKRRGVGMPRVVLVGRRDLL